MASSRESRGDAAADLRVLLGAILGAFCGIGLSQWLKAAVEAGPVAPWVVMAVISAAGLIALLAWYRTSARG